LAGNWRKLHGKQCAAAIAAAAACAAVALSEAEAGLLTLPLLGLSASMGAALALAAGPRLEILRELDIEEGSMTISGDEKELMVMVGKRTAPRRVLACGAAIGLLLGLGALADAVVVDGQVLALEAMLEEVLSGRGGDLESLHLLFEAIPEAFSTV
jgi:hypothetical protein